MKNYKKFFISTLVSFLIAIIAVSLFLLFVGYTFIGKNVYTRGASNINYWLTVKNQRAEALDKSGNKIVFCSGSNTLHGLNSKYASEVTGLPVLNFGLHAAFGTYMFELAKQILKPGDIVILPLEFGFYELEKDENLQSPFAEWIISYSPEYYKKSDIKRKFGLSFFLIQTWIFNPKFDYKDYAKTDEYVDQINDIGDFIKHDGTTDKFLKLKSPEARITQKFPEQINKLPLYQFINYCIQNNVSVYGIMPNYYRSKDYTQEEINNYKAIKSFYENNGASFIGDYTSGGYADKMLFSDTGLHLNTEGQKLRTKWIIDNVLSIPEIKNINNPKY